MTRKRDVDRLAVKWRDRLWLGQWLISTEIVDELPDSCAGGDFETTARCTSNPMYHSALVKVVSPVWDNRSPKQQNRTMCHEMVHAATSPVNDFVHDLIDALPKAKQDVYREWWKSLDEGQTEHWCNVLLESFKELR